MPSLPLHRPAEIILFVDLREHAIFAIRNLLDGNDENQAVVQAMTPLNEALTEIGKSEVGITAG